MSLADQTCVPCRGDVSPMEETKAREMLKELHEGWSINGRGHIERLYGFNNFIEAMAFANQLGDIAEEQGHHPDLYIAWGKCKVEIWTHKINGLTPSDFYLAAKADRIGSDDGR